MNIFAKNVALNLNAVVLMIMLMMKFIVQFVKAQKRKEPYQNFL